MQSIFLLRDSQAHQEITDYRQSDKKQTNYRQQERKKNRCIVPSNGIPSTGYPKTLVQYPANPPRRNTTINPSLYTSRDSADKMSALQCHCPSACEQSLYMSPYTMVLMPCFSSHLDRVGFFHWLWFEGQGGFISLALLPYSFHIEPFCVITPKSSFVEYKNKN